jgi:hypothetical protein
MPVKARRRSRPRGPACPACPVAPADGTGVGPEDLFAVSLADRTGGSPVALADGTGVDFTGVICGPRMLLFCYLFPNDFIAFNTQIG